MTDDDHAVREAAGGARIFQASRLPIVDRGHGIRSTPLLGGSTGSAVLSTGYTVIPPGERIPWHTHDVDESIVIMDGEGTCEFRDEIHAVQRDDATLIPAGIVHRFRNDSAAPLRILWIYPSASVVRHLVDEETVLDHLAPYPEDPVT